MIRPSYLWEAETGARLVEPDVLVFADDDLMRLDAWSIRFDWCVRLV